LLHVSPLSNSRSGSGLLIFARKAQYSTEHFTNLDLDRVSRDTESSDRVRDIPSERSAPRGQRDDLAELVG
jgi:hypothetical protein